MVGLESKRVEVVEYDATWPEVFNAEKKELEQLFAKAELCATIEHVGSTAVRDLKAKPGRELQVHGSGVLLRWLLERDLVDELNLRLYPVIVGDGLRLFPEHGQTHDLTLVESRSLPSGVTLLTYRPAGRVTFGTAGE